MILNRNKSKKPIITMDVSRHAEKDRSGNITKLGKLQSKIAGIKLDPNKRLKTYASSSQRAKDTANIVEANFRGNKVMSNLKIKKDLNENNAFPFVKDFLENFKNLAGNNQKMGNKMVKMWLNKKLPKTIVKNPQEIADIVIKKRIGSVVRYLRILEKQGKLNQIPETHIQVVTHAGIIMPVYERLTEQKYFERYNKMPNGTEGLKITFFKDENNLQIIMSFRKEQFDVTRKVIEILKK